MYCKNCGKEIDETFNHCPGCGAKLKEEPNYNVKKEEDNLTLWTFLSFFVPIAGLILFIIWNDDKPKTAKACGKGALIGTIVFTIIGIIISVFMWIYMMGILQHYPYPY